MTASPNLIGLGAGIVAAVLFASLANNSALALLLFYLTPLPLLLAGIGWGVRAGVLSVLTSTALLGLLLSPQSALEYGAYIGLPGIVVSYLTGLHRETGIASAAAAPGDAGQIEWYPIGRIIAWTTIMAGVLYGGTVLFGAQEMEANRLTIRALLKNFAEQDPSFYRNTGLAHRDLDQLAHLGAFYLIPFFKPMFWLLVMVGNLWLAIRSAAISGLLARPTPDFFQIAYPPFVLTGFGIAVAAAALAPGVAGTIAITFLGAFYSAYLILGSVVAHVLWSSSPLKPLFAVLLYAGLILAHGIVGPCIALLGLAETVLHLRRRSGRLTPPGNGPGQTH
jgi:hypothetical protein